MTIRPIIFSGPMVRALLGGTKTQTRRVLKPQPPPDRRLVGLYAPGLTAVFDRDDPASVDWTQRLRYMPGDLLYVREAWRLNSWATDVATFFYRASEGQGYTAMCEQWPVAGREIMKPNPGNWRPSIHMPRWASRITLKVTGVKVERVQDISEEDAKAEGVRLMRDGGGTFVGREGPGRMVTPWPTAKEAFADLWDSINADRGYGWLANPWVVCVSFEVIKANVDSLSNPGPGD